MMDDTNPFAQAAAAPHADNPAESPAAPANRQALPADAGVASPAVEKFKSCRWRATPDVGEFCTHRDVLPFAGKEGFVAESWCPDCSFYKLRRTPKKRERLDFSY
ncbi:MAG: hypothetical protein ACJ731_06340 [Vicinamibacterales bacterium]